MFNLCIRSSNDENRLEDNYNNVAVFLPVQVGGFPGLHRGPPRMEPEGRDYLELCGGRPRRGGVAGSTSKYRHGLSLSTDTMS